MPRLMLEIYGPGDDGSLIDVRSRQHMTYDHDPRIAPVPALVGWANRNWDYNGDESWEAAYAGPYRGARQFATFAGPAEAVQWIAERFAEEHGMATCHSCGHVADAAEMKPSLTTSWVDTGNVVCRDPEACFTRWLARDREQRPADMLRARTED